MSRLITDFKNAGIIPVLVLDFAEDAVPVGAALREGGIYCAEVTFRTPAAAEGIHLMKKAFPDMLVGAGTVLNKTQVDAAVQAGAEFIVAPGLDEDVVTYCQGEGIFIIPGVSTASEVEKAYSLGVRAVKFFPAEAAGGLDMIKSISAPFGSMVFVPTGGINQKNMLKYLDHPKILACGGSWMVKEELIKAREFSEISRLSREAVSSMLELQIGQVGLADNTSDLAIDAVLAETGIKILKDSGPEKSGYIAVGTRNVGRARFYLEKKGLRFREETAVYRDEELVCLYMEKKIAGFDTYLVKK